MELPLGYAIHVCSLFAQLTVRGITVLVESGIHGVGAGSCQDASGNVQFIAEFPSTCMCSIFIKPPKRYTSANTRHSPDRHDFAGPYVTSVGGTTKNDPEIAAKISGGGFSSYFPRPLYQDQLVPLWFLQPGHQYPGRFKCARCRDLNSFLTLYFVQPFGSWLPRYLRASTQLRGRRQQGRHSLGRHELRGFSVSFPTS